MSAAATEIDVPAARSTPPAWLPAAAAGTTLLLWASAFVAIRHLGDDVPPGALSLGRLGVAALVLGLILLARRVRSGARPSWPERRRVPLLLLCGTAWFGVYNLALNEAERRIDAGTAALVIQVGPLLVALFAAAFLGERLHRWTAAGMVLGFLGVAVIGLGSGSGSGGDALGVALAALAALTYAVGVLAQKPVVERAGPLEVTFLAALIGAVVCLPWAGQLLDVLREAPASALWWTAYLGVFPTAVAFTTWAYALRHTGAGKLSLTTFLVPAITTLLAWALLAEVPPALAFVGGAMAIAGVLLTRVRPRAT